MFPIKAIAKQLTRATSGVISPEIFSISVCRIEPAVAYPQSFHFPLVLTSDNLCLVMARSRPSGNLLLKIPEINEIQASLLIPENLSIPEIDIPQPAVFDCTDWFIEGVMCSENYVEPFTPTRTFKYEKVIFFASQVSENLFFSLNAPEIFGHYFGQDKKQQNKDKIPTSSPSQWDLLLPILLPPLSLEFPKKLGG
jgi:hypothetical protein